MEASTLREPDRTAIERLGSLLCEEAARAIGRTGLQCWMDNPLYSTGWRGRNEFWYRATRPKLDTVSGKEVWRVPGLLQFTLRSSAEFCEECLEHISDEIIESLSYRRYEAGPNEHLEIDLLKAVRILHYKKPVTVVDASFHFICAANS